MAVSDPHLPPTGGDPPPVVQATGITKRFGQTTALLDAGLTVQAGEVHALVGRNGAGKSTLVSILTGLQDPDAGEVLFGGRPAPARDDRAGWQRHVACVYQRTTIVPDLTVAENLFLNRQSTGGPIRWRRLNRRAAELLERWDVAVAPTTPARELKVEQRQMVEIARSLDLGSRFVILDEPTAQLEAPAAARLFDRIRSMQEQGVTFLYISHHLSEVFDLCQAVTVFRDARRVLDQRVETISQADLVGAMTGDASRAAAAWAPGPAAGRDGEPVLRLDGLRVPGEVLDVSLEVAAGEILGVAGIGGSGKVALAEAIAGVGPRSGGTVTVDGTPVGAGDVRGALRAGLGFVPQDRHHEGFVPRLSIAENATMTISERFGRGGWIDGRRQQDAGRRMMGRLDIKSDGPNQPVDELSGGNAQKVVMARALANDPCTLVLINPTAGVDVRSKESLLSTVRSAAEDGTGVLLVSDEAEDLRICHRVVVMFEGRLRPELPPGWTDRDLVAATEGVAV